MNSKTKGVSVARFAEAVLWTTAHLGYSEEFGELPTTKLAALELSMYFVLRIGRRGRGLRRFFYPNLERMGEVIARYKGSSKAISKSTLSESLNHLHRWGIIVYEKKGPETKKMKRLYGEKEGIQITISKNPLKEVRNRTPNIVIKNKTSTIPEAD